MLLVFINAKMLQNKIKKLLKGFSNTTNCLIAITIYKYNLYDFIDY